MTVGPSMGSSKDTESTGEVQGLRITTTQVDRASVRLMLTANQLYSRYD